MSTADAQRLAAGLDEDEAYLRELTEIGERKRDAATEADLAANMPAFRELMVDPAVQRIMQRQVALGYPAPNDVNRVLRDIKAKRAILARYEEFAAEQDRQLADPACKAVGPGIRTGTEVLGQVVAALAGVYEAQEPRRHAAR